MYSIKFLPCLVGQTLKHFLVSIWISCLGRNMSAVSLIERHEFKFKMLGCFIVISESIFGFIVESVDVLIGFCKFLVTRSCCLYVIFCAFLYNTIDFAVGTHFIKFYIRQRFINRLSFPIHKSKGFLKLCIESTFCHI